MVLTADVRFLWPFTLVALDPAIGATSVVFGTTLAAGLSW